MRVSVACVIDFQAPKGLKLYQLQLQKPMPEKAFFQLHVMICLMAAA